jgi:hypothetical protein
MAPVTYYYFISLFLAATPLLWLVNLVYLRKKDRTIFEQVYVVGTPEYERVIKLASNRNIAITIVLELFLATNLAWSVLTVVSVNTPSSQSLLVIAPIVVVGLLVLGVFKLRKEYKADPTQAKYKKVTHKKNKDNDSWLS